MHNFQYPAKLTPDDDGKTIVVKFGDFPEAITQGKNIQHALTQARDCLEEAVAGRINRKEEIPQPNKPNNGDYLVSLPAQTTVKAILYQAVKHSNMTKVDLAKKCNCDEKEVRRLLDPRQPSKLPRIEKVLAKLGHHLVITACTPKS